MDKVGGPHSIVTYSTVAAQEAAACKQPAPPVRILRARIFVYLGLIALVSAIMLGAWLMRSVLEMNVLHDRNPPFVQLSDGSLRNGYTVKILNKLHEPRTFQLDVSGLPGAKLMVVGLDEPAIKVSTDDLREIKVFVTVPRDQVSALGQTMTTFSLVIRDRESGRETTRQARFQRP